MNNKICAYFRFSSREKMLRFFQLKPNSPHKKSSKSKRLDCCNQSNL